MTLQAEGTIVVDGLLEGPAPPHPQAAAQLRQWRQHAASAGLEFHLELDGQRFSLLAGNHPMPVRLLGGCPTQRIADMLGALLAILPLQKRAEVFSTLRTTEWRPGQEVQTVFGVGAGGSIEIVERVMPARTSCPIRWPRPWQRRWAVAGGAVLAAAAIVTVLLASWPGLRAWLADRGMAPHVGELSADAGPFAPYLSLQPLAAARSGSVLVVRVQRGELFPRSADDHDRLLDQAASLNERLAIEALARGYVAVEFLDHQGRFLGRHEIRLVDLRDQPAVEIRLPLPPGPRVHSLVLAP